MKKPSADLFELIQSLSQTEKRYFKIYAQYSSSDPNYLKVFDAIEKQKKYNEQEIIDKFKGQAVAKSFSSAKNYLYNQILQSLNAYHSGLSVEFILNDLLRSARILEYKRLTKQSLKLIRKGIKLARKYEKLLLLIEFLQLEFQLETYRVSGDKLEFFLANHFDQIKKILTTYRHERELMVVIGKLIVAAVKRENIDVGLGSNKELKSIMSANVLNKTELNTSLHSKYTYYGIMSQYYKLLMDYEQAYVYSKKRIGAFEAEPHRIDEMPVHRSESLRVHCELCLYTNRYDEFKQYRNLFRQFLYNWPTNIPGRSPELYTSLFNLELLYHLETADFSEFNHTVQEIESALKKHKLESSSLIGIFNVVIYRVAYIYIIIGNYKTALYWINKVLSKETPLSDDYYSFIRGINIIVHYELNNQDHLEYVIKSTSKSLRQSGNVFKFEELIIRFIRNFRQAKDKSEQLKVLKSTRKDFEAIRNHPKEKVAFRFFDIFSWIDAKIEGKSFLEMYQRNLKNKATSS